MLSPVAFPTRHASPRLSLVCFPYAGGSAVTFRGWGNVLPGIDLLPVEIPGHGTRLQEKPLQTVASISQQLMASDLFNVKKLALYGHSLGAYLAFDVAHRLEARGIFLTSLHVSGRDAPPKTPRQPTFCELDDTKLTRSLVRLGGIPQQIAECPDMLDFFMPIIRADLRATEYYVNTHDRPLRCPVHVYAAQDDPLTTPQGVKRWRHESSDRVRFHGFSGGHFFANPTNASFCRTFSSNLLAESESFVA